MSDVQEIEVSMANARATVEMGNKLERLLKNPDFQELIMTGYLQSEAIRLVQSKTKPGMESPERQASVIRGIDGVSEFHQFLHRIDRAADMALQAIEQLEETQAEMAEQGEL